MNAQTFINALGALENDRDLDTISSMFADDAELRNPHVHDPMSGRDGARRFWQQYRDAFGDIRSEFRSVIETDSSASLEWVSNGTLSPTGQSAHYGGVSILEWSDAGIQRFATYFDTEQLRLNGGSDPQR